MGTLTKNFSLKSASAPVGSHMPLAHGWDTIVEAYDIFPSDRVISVMETVKERAAADGERIPFQLGGVTVWMWPKGLRSWSWVIEDDAGRFMMRFRARAPSYGVMVEYRSAALWALRDAFDWSELQAEIDAMLRSFCATRSGVEQPVLVSRADYAFDFYAPEFSRSSTPALFDLWSAHQEVKRRMQSGDFWGRRRIETWTLGKKKSLQVQLYNKALEITEVSGKDWMSDIYKANADANRLACYEGKPVDVWRLEIRMGKDWLKRRWFQVDDAKRSARRRDIFTDHIGDLISDAMQSIQLKEPEIPGRAKQLNRRPAHWFWGVASEAIGAATARPYVARLTTGRRKALSEMFRKSAFGYLRSLSVLETGECDEDTLDDLLADARAGVLADPEHRLKVDRADRRYALVDRPS